MNLHTIMSSSFLVIVLHLTFSISTCFADDSPLQDVCPTALQGDRSQKLFINGFPCKNHNNISAPDFKTSLLNHAGDVDNFFRSFVNVVTAAEFPGLNTQSLSMARTDLAMDGAVLPHSHPRASEMMYVAHGTMVAGFADSNGRLFQRTIDEGDVFMFPRGLLHFCVNAGFGLATAYSVFNSQNPGVASIAGSMFTPESEVVQRMVERMLRLKSDGNG
uniref:Germin-like protein n=1 Tax=Ananas comosus var. bracteatus TaxID=296719 RepID=A0A6V7PSR4_ANACO|nr:unnamed protein product [Ananas comosus var. bracteatus]